MSTLEILQAKYKQRTGLTVSEVAEELNTSADQVRKLLQRGKIPAVHIGARWYVPIGQFAALLDGENHERNQFND